MTAGSSRRPWALGTGLPAQNFAQGRIKYVDLDLTRMEGKFAPDIAIPRTPFQRILGVAPPDGFFPPLSPGVTSSAPADPVTTTRIERAPTIGRPLGAPEWVAALERWLGRALALAKPGSKPRADEDTTRKPWLL